MATSAVLNALSATDESLAEFRKDPRTFLQKKCKIEITAKQSAELKRFVSDCNELTFSFGNEDKIGAWNKKKWKKVIKKLGELIDAILS